MRGLEEAIAIIRAIWAGAGSIKVYGEEYRVVGAKPGPVPAHDIGIWIGAYKPRMLRLVGRLVDGWLPSLGYAGVDKLAGMSRIIDEAAERAGRAPAAIRCLYNINGAFGSWPGSGVSGFLRGNPSDWAQQLAELTMTEGISTYILGSDEPSDIQRFGLEVAPEVKELVEGYRSGGAPRLPQPEPARQRVVANAASGAFDVCNPG